MGPADGPEGDDGPADVALPVRDVASQGPEAARRTLQLFDERRGDMEQRAPVVRAHAPKRGAPRGPRKKKPIGARWQPEGRTILLLEGQGVSKERTKGIVPAYISAMAGQERKTWREQDFIDWAVAANREMP